MIEQDQDQFTVRTRERQQRRAPRDSLFLCATIRRQSDPVGDLAPVRIRNLSPVGLMADYDEMVAVDDAVTVTCRGIGSVGGRVAWVKRGQIGIAFNTEVDPMLARRPVGAASASTAKKATRPL